QSRLSQFRFNRFAASSEPLVDLATCTLSPYLSSSTSLESVPHTYASRRSRSVKFKIRNRANEREKVTVVVVVSIIRRHDPSNPPFKTTCAADDATIRGERSAGYYLASIEEEGETARVWQNNVQTVRHGQSMGIDS